MKRQSVFQNYLRSKGLVKGFAISCVLIWLLSVVMNIIVYCAVNVSLVHDIDSYNKSIMESRTDGIDNALSGIAKNAVRISLNNEIKNAVLLEGNVTTEQRYHFYEKMKDVIFSDGEQVESIFVYCNESDTVLSYGGAMTADQYYDAYLSEYYNGCSEWMDTILAAPKEALIKSDKKDMSGRYTLFYIYKFNPAGYPESEGIVISQLKHSLMFSDSDVMEYVTDGDLNILSSNTDEIPDIFEKYRNGEKKEDSSYVISAFDSSSLNIKYVYITPKSVFLKGVNDIRSIMLIGNFIVALIGIIWVIYFVKLNNSLIRQFMASISEMTGTDANDKGTEYVRIQNAVKSISEKYHNAQDNLEFEKGIIASSRKQQYVKQQIIDCIEKNDIDGAKQAIRSLLSYASDKNADTAAVKHIIFDITATVLRYANTTHNYEKWVELLDDISGQSDYGEAEKYEKMIMEFLDLCIIPKKQEGKNKFLETVEEFIQNNYTNHEMSVEFVAQGIGMSKHYVAEKYKSQRGISISDYINILRIEAAKKELVSTGDKLDAVANRVGYTNDRTFTRIFNKMVGMTPGKFREQNIQ